MLSLELANHLARVLMAFGFGSVAVAAVILDRRSGAAESGTPPAVARAVTGASILLVLFGWLAFLWLLRAATLGEIADFMRDHPKRTAPTGEELQASIAEARVPAILLMAGLTAVGVTARLGMGLEQARLRTLGAGTPLATMMKRATVLFLVLSVATAALLLVRPPETRTLRLAVLGGLSAFWIPTALAWACGPAGSVGPAPSVAWRATFFSLVLPAIVSVAAPVFLEVWPARAANLAVTGLGMGVALGAVAQVLVAWLATRMSVKGSILLSGLVAGMGGLCLHFSL